MDDNDGILSSFPAVKFAHSGYVSDSVMQVLAEESPDAVMVIDAQGRLIWVNRQVENLFGYGRTELVGQLVELLVPVEARRSHVGVRTAFMESPHTRRMGVGINLEARRSDGATFPVEVSLTPISTYGGDSVIATVRDISERQAAAAEQSALRRVATLAAEGESPEVVFTAVAAEVGRVLDIEFTSLGKFHPDGAVTIVGAWSGTGSQIIFPVGTQIPAGGTNIHSLLFRTHKPVRLDTIVDDVGPALAPALAAGIRASVGVPIKVEGELWGLVICSSTRGVPLPAGTELRLAGFTQLVATVIANAQARLQLRGFAEEQAALPTRGDASRPGSATGGSVCWGD